MRRVGVCAVLTGERRGGAHTRDTYGHCAQLLMEEYWYAHNATVALDYDGVLFSTVSASSDSSSSACEVVATRQAHGDTHMCHTETRTCPVRLAHHVAPVSLHAL